MRGVLIPGVFVLLTIGLAQVGNAEERCDLTGDGIVDYRDLFVFMVQWQRVIATPVTPTPTGVSSPTPTPTETPFPTLTPTFTPSRTPSPTPTGDTHTISGYVAEFPGCGGRMRGVWVTLLPLGRTVQTSVADGSFAFAGVPDGNYTLSLGGYCNPFGCYPDTPVTVAGADVFVTICPVAPLPTWTPTPTASPTPT